MLCIGVAFHQPMPWNASKSLFGDSFTVVFYGVQIFCCKMAQFCATRRESDFPRHLVSARMRKTAKICAKSLS